VSLNTILNSGMSGLAAAQTQLRVVSDNVANVNTVGYVRKIADQTSVVSAGIGAGVDVTRIRLSTDRFLQQATLDAASGASRAGVRAELYDRIQGQFGDPSTAASFFARVDQLFAKFGSVAEDPLSQPQRQEAITNAKAVFDEAARLAASIQSVRTDTDARIASAMDKINGLLVDIEELNKEISRSTISGKDASGAETAQAQLIDQLSQMLDVRVGLRSTGGVTIRTGDGVLLAGDGVATFAYDRAGVATPETTFNEIWVTPPGGQKVALLDHLGSGELKGLVDVRDVEAPQAAERLAELTAKVADELNRAHNANSSVPAPLTLTGRNTGLDLPTAIAGFTGRTTVAITNSAGVIQRRVEIDFDAMTMSVDGGAAAGFTAGTFLASLNGGLGALGSASFSGGALNLSATGANGVAIADDPANPSAKAGRGFSWFFGLNDLVRSDQISTYETGLTGASAHGFSAGQEIIFRFSSPAGSRLRDITVAVPAGGTMANLLTALNDVGTGVGRYGSFALDAQGKLSFTPSISPAATLSVVGDQTSRGAGGPSFTELFGVGSGTRASRADSFSIRDDIYRDPRKLAVAQLDLTAAAGTSALSSGDGRGARLLADAGERTTSFDPAGGTVGGAMTVSRYLSDYAGDLGARAADAEARKQSAETLMEEAASRRASYEGVNLDEELVKLTTYQQAFNASARLIQAAKDLYDILLGMV
jgi:flagellar hook-associated protein 1 FlgK